MKRRPAITSLGVGQEARYAKLLRRYGRAHTLCLALLETLAGCLRQLLHSVSRNTHIGGNCAHRLLRSNPRPQISLVECDAELPEHLLSTVAFSLASVERNQGNENA